VNDYKARAARLSTDSERIVSMNTCPVCCTDAQEEMCRCGYSFADQKIVDWEAARIALGAIPKSDWPARVQFERMANTVQVRKLGPSVTNRSGKGWSQARTARALDITPMTMSRDVRLAEALEQFPDLAQCSTKAEAQRRLDELQAPAGDGGPAGLYPSGFESEADLQQYLEHNWPQTTLADEWVLYREGHVDAGEIGIIDLLAKHKREPQWLVVELKVRKTSDQAVGQVLRYMGWVKRTLAAQGEQVNGLIIAKYPDPKTLYALDSVTHVSLP